MTTKLEIELKVAQERVADLSTKVAEAAAKIADADPKDFDSATTLHSAACKETHNTRHGCAWFAEENDWSARSHTLWLDIAKAVAAL